MLVHWAGAGLHFLSEFGGAKKVEPIDGDTGFSAAISWMHDLGAESEH